MFELLVESAFLAVCLMIAYKSRKAADYHLPWPILLYIIMVFASAVYGFSMAENYSDIKMLIRNTLAYSLCLSFFLFIQPSKVAMTLKYWFFSAIILFVVFFPILRNAYALFLLPLSFLLLFSPFFQKKSMLIVLLFVGIYFIIGSLGDRSSIARFLFCILLGLGVAFRSIIPTSILRFAVVVEFLCPLVLLVLAVTGSFNVFDIGESTGASDVEIQNSTDGVDNLGADTRSFIYVEEFLSAVNHGYLIQGRSVARGYESPFFGADDPSNRGEREDSEVGILNTFNYFGIVGVIVTLVVFLGAVVSVFRKAKGKILYFFAIYVGYRWLWSFVEDPQFFNLNTICLWISISMCYSPLFNNMTDAQFAFWARRIICIDE